jgi:small subunit ribosomal protein S14
MAKVSAMDKNKKRKEKIERFAARRAELKRISEDESLAAEVRVGAMIKLSELPRNSSRVRYRNRCELTGRPRAYHGYFGISRIMLRQLAAQGRIPGLKKSSW